MFAIQNVKTGKFLYGTDWNYSPPQQRTSLNRVATYEDLWTAKVDFLHRGCGKDYKIVRLAPVSVIEVIEPPTAWEEVRYNDSKIT